MGAVGLGTQGTPILSLLILSQASADGPSAHGGLQEDRQLEKVVFMDHRAPRPSWPWSQHSDTWSSPILSGEAPMAAGPLLFVL